MVLLIAGVVLVPLDSFHLRRFTWARAWTTWRGVPTTSGPGISGGLVSHPVSAEQCGGRRAGLRVDTELLGRHLQATPRRNGRGEEGWSGAPFVHALSSSTYGSIHPVNFQFSTYGSRTHALSSGTYRSIHPVNFQLSVRFWLIVD
jgi:hypothetical protein